jgi:predicted component of type VI protein secretion system
MSLYERLRDFAGSIATATSDAPDEYPEWSSWTYETHMEDLRSLWAAIRPQLKRDLEQAAWVDQKLQEMFTAFDAGDKETGRKAAWALYNAEVTKLR